MRVRGGMAPTEAEEEEELKKQPKEGWMQPTTRTLTHFTHLLVASARVNAPTMRDLGRTDRGGGGRTRRASLGASIKLSLW